MCPERTSLDWRRGRDSNPRYGCPYAAFRVRCIQPLCHLSKPLELLDNHYILLIAQRAGRCPSATQSFWCASLLRLRDQGQRARRVFLHSRHNGRPRIDPLFAAKEISGRRAQAQRPARRTSNQAPISRTGKPPLGQALMAPMIFALRFVECSGPFSHAPFEIDKVVVHLLKRESECEDTFRLLTGKSAR